MNSRVNILKAAAAVRGWLAVPGGGLVVLGMLQPCPGAVTFSGEIAKVVHRHCAPCHHEGQAAPFNLLTYEDVRKRARQVLEVVERDQMPPWLAEPGYGDFANERRLSDAEKAQLREWVEADAPEGDPNETPPIPKWPAGWLSGTPDLVVTMPQAYELGPEGPDVYRNFAIRIPLEGDRLVHAVEFAPGNPRAVHHAFVRIDEEGKARSLEGREARPGFDTMIPTARMPGGQFLTWNPGSQPVVSPPGLAWRLPKGSDLVLELHLNRTGKTEPVQAAVGFHFTEEPPTNTCHTFKLGSLDLDFPAGATNTIVRDAAELPVDVDVLAVYPHAHFLAREMKGHATLPDGTREWLIWIRRWDFNWQGEYRFRKPLRLPKGTRVELEFIYDNSTNNPANPHHPPKRVLYGEQSTDEMCELGLQVLTHRPGDLQVLEEFGRRQRDRRVEAWLRGRLARDASDAEAMTRLGLILWTSNRSQEGWQHLDRAVRMRPDFAEAHYNQGVFLRFHGQPAAARQALETALRLEPTFPRAHQQLGFTFAQLGLAAEAERSFEKALELNPADTESRAGLTELRQILRSRGNPN